MVQVPAASNAAVFPDTLQIVEVFEAKARDKPDDADALSGTVVPTVWAAMDGNVMV